MKEASRFFRWALCVIITLIGARAAAQVNPARPVFTEIGAALEKEIASRMVRRPETTGEKLARMEIGIDLRLLCRSAATVAAGVQGDAQANARLRLRLFMDALNVVEETFARQTEKLTPAQMDAAAKLRRLTFVEIKALRELENTSKALAPLVLALTGTPWDGKALPAVRPVAARVVVRDDTPRTVVSLAEEVTRINVSLALRQQLSVLAREAMQLNQPGANASKETQGLARAYALALEAGIDLARGLQFNTAIAPEARLEAEVQLSEGIALFMDPRTRAMGQERISSMAQYRQTLGRIGKLGLSVQEMDQFGPLFMWARQTPEPGSRAMAALEGYVQMRAQFAARPKQQNTMPTLRRSIEELEKQFAGVSAALVAGAVDVPRGGSARVADVEQQAGELRRVVTLLNQLDLMPQTLDVLGQFKPRPTGGLERRVAAAAVIASKAEASKERAEATALIDAVHQLAGTAVELGKFDASTISPTVERRCAGGKLAALDARWRQMVMELASAAAAGSAVDAGRLARVQSAKVLQDAVTRATVLEAALWDADLLARWVDWGMTAEELKPLLLPYQEAMADAFAAYVSDTPSAIETWNKTEKRYEKVIELMIKAGSYRQQCAAFPTGVVNLAASLNAPLEGAPFAQERFAALALDVYRSRVAAGETAAGQQMLASLFKRLE